MPVRSDIAMGTIVTIHVVAENSEPAIERAFAWFHDVEARCSRFLPDSELMRLRPGIANPASDLLFEAVQFALTVAEETGGAFDPTVGDEMHRRGFNREHRTGEIVPAPASDGAATFRDVQLNPIDKTIVLHKPLTLDLGAVAKGLAVDLAARELAPHRDFAIDAGGDLYLGGRNPKGAPWSVGIRHPRQDGAIIDTVTVTDSAVCTSGDYERGEHIVDSRGDAAEAAHSLASATVIADSAMMADALSTAAFVLGPRDGLALLERMSVQGLLIAPDLTRYETRGLKRAA